MAELDDTYDQWLVLRFQDGDKRALAELVERWQPRLFRQAMRLVERPADAEEVVQTAWVSIVRGLRGLRDPACYRRWAYRIVTNKAADWIRLRQRDRILAQPLEEEPSDTTPGEQAEEVDILRCTLRQLPNDQRMILGLFYLEEMSVSEVAHVLDLSPGTVKSRLFHARKKMKEKLEREGL